MSLSQPEPGEYGWRGFEFEDRNLPRQPWERFRPAVPGPDTVSGDLEGAAFMARSDDEE